MKAIYAREQVLKTTATKIAVSLQSSNPAIVQQAIKSVIFSPTNKTMISKDTVSISTAAQTAAKQLTSRSTAKSVVAKTPVSAVVHQPIQKSGITKDTVNISVAAHLAAAKNIDNKSTSVTNLTVAKQVAVKSSSSGKSPTTTSIKTLVDKLEELEKYTKKYLTIDTTSRINDHNLEYIRAASGRYDDWRWSTIAGNVNDDHVKYIESKDKKLDAFFSPKGEGTYLKDPKSGEKIDVAHLMATIDGILSNPSNRVNALAGWGGDLQTAVNDVQKITNNSNKMSTLNSAAKKVIGGNSSFSMPDLLADIDAVNIANMLQKNSKLLLSDAVEKYYSKKGDVNERYSNFIDSFGGKNKFIEEVNKVIDDPTPLLNKGIKDNQFEATANAFTNFVIQEAKKE